MVAKFALELHWRSVCSGISLWFSLLWVFTLVQSACVLSALRLLSGSVCSATTLAKSGLGLNLLWDFSLAQFALRLNSSVSIWTGLSLLGGFSLSQFALRLYSGSIWSGTRSNLRLLSGAVCSIWSGIQSEAFLWRSLLYDHSGVIWSGTQSALGLLSGSAYSATSRWLNLM